MGHGADGPPLHRLVGLKPRAASALVATTLARHRALSRGLNYRVLVLAGRSSGRNSVDTPSVARVLAASGAARTSRAALVGLCGREPICGQCPRDRRTVARVTQCPLTFAIVKICKERKSRSNLPFPTSQVHRLRQFPDAILGEVFLLSPCQDLGRIEWPRPAVIVHHVRPHFQHPQAAD